jgi:hypothetical protein
MLLRAGLHTCVRAAARRAAAVTAAARADESLAPVPRIAVPAEETGSVVTGESRAAPLLQFPYLVVQRQLEMMQLLVGFEQVRAGRGGGSKRGRRQ